MVQTNLNLNLWMEAQVKSRFDNFLPVALAAGLF